MNTSMFTTLDHLRYAGRVQSISLDQFDQMFCPKQLCARLGQAASAQAPRRVWPSALDAGRQAGLAPSLKDVADQLPESQARDLELKLAEATRIVTACGDKEDFEMNLQIFRATAWMTIASYAVQKGRAQRSIHYCDGQRYPIFMDLPSHVVLEMAKEDFMRNWSIYYREFFAVPQGRPSFPRA